MALDVGYIVTSAPHPEPQALACADIPRHGCSVLNLRATPRTVTGSSPECSLSGFRIVWWQI